MMPQCRANKVGKARKWKGRKTVCEVLKDIPTLLSPCRHLNNNLQGRGEVSKEIKITLPHRVTSNYYVSRLGDTVGKGLGKACWRHEDLLEPHHVTNIIVLQGWVTRWGKG